MKLKSSRNSTSTVEPLCDVLREEIDRAVKKHHDYVIREAIAQRAVEEQSVPTGDDDTHDKPVEQPEVALQEQVKQAIASLKLIESCLSRSVCFRNLCRTTPMWATC